MCFDMLGLLLVVDNSFLERPVILDMLLRVRTCTMITNDVDIIPMSSLSEIAKMSWNFLIRKFLSANKHFEKRSLTMIKLLGPVANHFQNSRVSIA